jgi:hypothetical protein
MKKWFVLIALAALVGCQLPIPQSQNLYNGIEVNTPEEIETWILDEHNIAETTDLKTWGKSAYVAWPSEIMDRRAGDCDCRAMLFGDMCIQILGYSPDSIRVITIEGHCFIQLDGKDYLSWNASGYTILVNDSWEEFQQFAARTHRL